MKSEGLARLDGATGYRCLAKGVDPSRVAIQAPGFLRELHRADLKAGATAITSATFSTVDERAFRAAVDIAREEAGNAMVVASIGPIVPEKRLIHMAERALEAGVDYVAFETFVEPERLLRCVKALRGAAVIASHHPVDGIKFDWAALIDAGVHAIGVNCGANLAPPGGFEAFTQQAIELARFGLPVYFRPSAGVPVDGRYPVEVERFAEGLRRARRAGVAYLGGCCGVGPHYLRAAYSIDSTNTPGGGD